MEVKILVCDWCKTPINKGEYAIAEVSKNFTHFHRGCFDSMSAKDLVVYSDMEKFYVSGPNGPMRAAPFWSTHVPAEN